MRLLQWAVVVASLAVGGAALAAEPSAGETSAKDIWMAKCKGCHGEDGKAKTKVGRKENIPDFTSPGWQKHNSDDEIRDVITNGSKDNHKMKAFKERLTPAEIDSLVKYIRALGTPQK